MSFKSSDYLGRLAKIAHPDQVSGYMQLEEVLKTLSIHPQSFEISKQNFIDSLITELTSRGVKNIRAPLRAGGKFACLMIQTCQGNWTNTIPENTSAIQLNKTATEQDTTAAQGYFGKTAQGVESSEHLQFWIEFSTAYGLFDQFTLMKNATAL
ncbi:MAG: hypothetical protein EZS28_017415 [Streblomastix strix]|uniref:Uncharacterized protein n=1 Tax=Streblomastix strix TaxID=222440 RepID=A0A5J4VWP1_9EUKA|nr:MAG: hypothetical protein EZS28_017415 [Streblomastix strix]